MRAAVREDYRRSDTGRRRERARRLMGVDTLRWTGKTLELLDQRALPQKIEYLTCHTAAEAARAIREMVVRGAPAIGCAAAFGVALESTRAAGLEAAFEVLAHSRPTAVNLFWALSRMRRALARNGASALEDEALAIYEEDLAVNRAIGAHGAELVPDRARIMTHCNAGALATAGHGTALGVVRSARDQGKRISVVANETRPYLQGARLTAWEMVQERIPVTLVTDSMAGFLMSRGEVDLLIVGADRIAANGDVANKIGTYTLAVLARRHGLPFYVAAPLSTFDSSIAQGALIPIEERPPGEVTGYGGLRWAPDGVAVRNPAFDVTPAELVTGLITEVGVLRAPSRDGIATLLSRSFGGA
ncbi:MAG: S-methyl-5-thioribose-1-phosphate isomerase [Burkholderiales bacterium]